MYIPAFNRESDPATLLAFMRRYSFATLVTAPEGLPFATQLPLLVEEIGQGVRLRSHLARANPQWRHLDGREVLVMFQGPHALVDSAWYETRPNVPTWNYVSVHAYGPAHILPDEEAAEVAQAMLEAFTPDAPAIPDEYRVGMLRGVVTFELNVTRLEGKFKLSQNKSAADQSAVVAHLEASGREDDRELARLMRLRR